MSERSQPRSGRSPRSGSPLRSVEFSIPPREVHRGHRHDHWHLLQVREGELEEEGLGRIRAGEFRISPPGTVHHVAAGERSVVCRNDHLVAPRLATRVHGRHPLRQVVIRRPLAAGPLPATGSIVDEVARIERFFGAVRLAIDEDDRDLPAWLVDAREDVLCGGRSMAAIADAYRLSHAHFTRAYQGYLGMTPRVARERVRVQRVVDRITGTDQSLCEVALDHGFCDQSHMNRVVGKVTGRTPLAIRREALAIA